MGYQARMAALKLRGEEAGKRALEAYEVQTGTRLSMTGQGAP
jgi:hypothetical protein